MRIKSLLLAVLMILTSFNMTVFAAEGETPLSLDDIAWENLTYKDIFIENNLAYVDGFNGRDWGAFVKNAGNSTITNENFYTAPYSLKAFGSPSQQIKSSFELGKNGDYFVASKVYCTRYTKGELGVCLYNTTVGITETTEDFVTSSGIIKAEATHKIYIGSIHSADLDGYVDDPAVVNMAIFENAPSIEEMTELYDNYVEIEKAREREKIKYTDAEMLSAFVDYMNEKAAEIGMENSFFKDPVGMDNRTTAEDLLRLMVYTEQNYPEFEPFWSTETHIVKINGKNAREKTVTASFYSNPYLAPYYNILGIKGGSLSAPKIYNLAAILEIPDSEDKLAVIALYCEGKDGESGNRYQAVKEVADAALLKYNNPDYDNSSMDVCCKSAIACVIPAEGTDIENLEILYSKDAETVREPASISKVLTAICFLDYQKDFSETLAYKTADTNIGGFYTNDFLPGDEVSYSDALYALMLVSSNITAMAFGRETGEKILESKSDPCGSSAFWKIEEGVLKISGTGAIFNYNTTSEIPWYENGEEITAIEIGEGITAIGSRSFAGLENLVSVHLPESLEKIGTYAFWNCSSLYGISLPENLNEIGAGAFFGCSALDYIVIPSGVTVLEQSVFAQCEKLDTVVLHDDIIEIKKEAFSRCYGLFHFGMPLNLETVGYHAFFGCANLQQLTFAENIKKIEDAAFYGCTNLSVLRFSGNSPEFSVKAFLDITADVFYPLGDESWTETVEENYGGNITWCSECYHNYKDEITEPTCTVEGYTTHTCTICGESYIDAYTAPTGHSFGEWETVKEATFTEDGTESRTCVKCSHVEFRSVPLTVIDSGNFGYGSTPTDKIIYTLYSNGTMIVEGEGAIYGCYWNGRNQPFIDYREQIKHLIIGEGITSTTSGCFAYLTNLETVEFPSTLTKLPTNAFMASFAPSVTKITIPKSVVQIGSYVFGNYSGDGTYFTEAVFENPDIIIEDSKAVFNGGKRLDELTLYSYGIDNNVSTYAEKYGIRYIDLNDYFQGEYNGINYTLTSGVLILSTEGENMNIPSDAPWNEYRDSVTKIVIEDGITGISENAFKDYKNLSEVEMNDGVKIIGEGAFSVTESCEKELDLVFPRRIENIGKDIFKNRSNVNLKVYIGSAAEEINEPGVNLTVKKQYKFLMIGNSYTQDASSCLYTPQSQLFDMIQTMLGEDAEVTLGTIVSGGKGINWHATQAELNSKKYSFKVITTEGGQWETIGSFSSAEALAWTDWDAVSLQVYNINVNTGEESVPYPEQTAPKFYKLKDASEYMLDHIAKYAPFAETYFYMHWSQTSSIALNAALSGYNRLANYIPVVLDYEGTESGNKFKDIVPVGLSVQNARTTYLALLRYNTTAYADGNLNLTTDAQIGLQRDGGHLSFNIGRYIAGLTFAEMIIPEEMRVEGYVLPDIRITESVGKLPEEYTGISQKAVFAAVENWKNKSLAVTEIEGYKVDPVDTESAKLAETKIGVPCVANNESVKEKITEAVLELLPEDFSVESVVLAEDFEIIGEGQEFEAEVTVRFGYMSKSVTVSFAVEKALFGDINLDGKVDVMDAYYIRLVVAKLRKPTEQQIILGDVDCDGKITAIDANIIRKYAVKMITELPVK